MAKSTKNKKIQTKPLETVSSESVSSGFAVEYDDPYGDAVRRIYSALNPKAHIPGGGEFVLPFNDPAAKEALDNYILRAEGACDKQRASAAKKALTQFG